MTNLFMIAAFDKGAVGSFLNGIFLTIDSVIYTVVGYVYQIFIVLARVDFFSAETIGKFAGNIYLIIGVVMLFVVTYSLLKAMINPDDLSKGDTSVSKISLNVVKALVIIALVPTIFDFAKQIQISVVEENIIGAIILGEKTTTTKTEQIDNMKKAGYKLATDTFLGFLYPNENIDIVNIEPDPPMVITRDGEDYSIASFADAQRLSSEKGYFYGYNLFGKAVYDNQLNYFFPISLLAGAFLLYVIISFCLDLGIRVVKLGFFQLIAPIPAMSLIIPGQKKIFDNWLKITITTYLEVFIRLIVIFFGIFLVTEIPTAITNLNLGELNLSTGVSGFVTVAIILGIVAFMRQAPKLISDLFGLDSGNMKLGIGEKLAAGGAFIAGGALGAGATGLVRNAISGGKNIGNAYNTARASGKGRLASAWATKGALAKTPISMIGGVGSGLARGGMANKSAKTFGDLGKGISSAADATSAARDNRAAYRASHGGIKGAVLGHAADTIGSVGEYFGVNSSNALSLESAELDKYLELEKTIQAEAEKGVAGIIKTEMEELRKEPLKDKNGNIDYQATQSKLNSLKNQYDNEVQAFSIGEYMKTAKTGKGSLTTTTIKQREALAARNATKNGFKSLVKYDDIIKDVQVKNYSEEELATLAYTFTPQAEQNLGEIKKAKGAIADKLASSYGKPEKKSGKDGK